MISRTLPSVLPRQSPSSRIRSSISLEASAILNLLGWLVSARNPGGAELTRLVVQLVQEPVELLEVGAKLVHAPQRGRELREGRSRVGGEAHQPLLLLLELPGEDERAGPPLLEEPAEL